MLYFYFFLFLIYPKKNRQVRMESINLTLILNMMEKYGTTLKIWGGFYFFVSFLKLKY